MKKLILLICILASINCFAQKDTAGLNLPYKDGKLVYEKVIQINDKSKSDLYKNAKHWFVDFFKSSKDVIQSEDKEQGIILGKGIVIIHSKIIGFDVNYPDLITIQIDLKDNKYRYRIYDMQLSTETQYLNGFGTLSGKRFTPEDLIANVADGKHNVLTKGASKKVLVGISEKINDINYALNQAMNVSDSF